MKRTTTLFTDKKFKLDETGHCRLFAAHVHKDNVYSVKEFDDYRDLCTFVNTLIKHTYDFKNTRCTAKSYVTCNCGQTWSEFKISSLCFG